MSDDEYEYPGGWFGPTWGAPVCEDSQHLPAPVGEPCLYCESPFVDGDQGLTMPHYDGIVASLRSTHLACFLKEIGATNA